MSARPFDSVGERPRAADVRGMRQHAPGHVLKAIPLLREVVAHVVAHLLDEPTVRDGNLAQMRRVDDQLAAVRDDRFQLIHAFAGDPQLIVHRRRARQNLAEWPRDARDVHLRR